MKRLPVKASTIGEYVGRRLMTTWSANLLVYGAEESPDYEFEESFNGSFTDCLKKVEEYLGTIWEHDLDAYVTLEADNNNDSYTFYDIEDLYDTFPDEFEAVGAATRVQKGKKQVKASTEGARSYYIDKIVDMLKHSDMHDEIEDILAKFGASDDDSDPNEGFFSTMSTGDIKDAYYEIMRLSDKLVSSKREYEAFVDLLLANGFEDETVDGPEGSVEYFVKGSIGVVVGDPREARQLARKLL